MAEVRVLDIESSSSTSILEDSSVSEPVWIGEDEILYLKGENKEVTKLLVTSAAESQGV